MFSISCTIKMLDEFTYLAGKDDHILNNPGSLVLQELRNDVAADDTGPDDGEVCVSRHEILSHCMRDSSDHWCGSLPSYTYVLSLSHEHPSRPHYRAVQFERIHHCQLLMRAKADTPMSHSSMQPEPVERSVCY